MIVFRKWWQISRRWSAGPASPSQEPLDDSWPAIGQTHHDDGLAVEGQGVLLNRDEFLLFAHLSPLSRGVYTTCPSCLSVLSHCSCEEDPLQETLSSRYDTG